MASVHTCEFGQMSARWAGEIERVVINVGVGATIHLNPAEAQGLAAQLATAVAKGTASESSDRSGVAA